MTQTSSIRPLVITLAFVLAGIVIAALGGISHGSIVGGLVAGAGVVPACWAAWAGMQQKTQTSLAAALGLVFLSLGVGAVLIILRIVSALH